MWKFPPLTFLATYTRTYLYTWIPSVSNLCSRMRGCLSERVASHPQLKAKRWRDFTTLVSFSIDVYDYLSEKVAAYHLTIEVTVSWGRRQRR